MHYSTDFQQEAVESRACINYVTTSLLRSVSSKARGFRPKVPVQPVPLGETLQLSPLALHADLPPLPTPHSASESAVNIRKTLNY